MIQVILGGLVCVHLVEMSGTTLSHIPMFQPDVFSILSFSCFFLLKSIILFLDLLQSLSLPIVKTQMPFQASGQNLTQNVVFYVILPIS